MLFKVLCSYHVHVLTDMSTAFYLLSDYINVCHIQIKSNFSDLDYNKHIIWAEGKKTKQNKSSSIHHFPPLWHPQNFSITEKRFCLLRKGF